MRVCVLFFLFFLFSFVLPPAGLPAQSFASSHRALHDMVKGKLASGKLGHLANETFKLFEEKLHFYVKRYSTDQGSGTGVSLHNLVQSVMFHAGVESLFGRECISNSKVLERLITPPDSSPATSLMFGRTTCSSVYLEV